MSLTVICHDCPHPRDPRLLTQYRQNCLECAEDCVQRHLEAFPGHSVELTGWVPDTRKPFGPAGENIRRLFGGRVA